MTKEKATISKKLAGKEAHGRVDFIAQKSEIEGALADGWPAKVIWRHLVADKKISHSYQMFLTYINKYIKANKRHGKHPPASDNKTRINETTDTVPNQSEGFNYKQGPASGDKFY